MDPSSRRPGHRRRRGTSHLRRLPIAALCQLLRASVVPPGESGCGSPQRSGSCSDAYRDRVTGIDASATVLRHAHSRAGRAQFRLHDLERPLDFAADASFDGIVCALVIGHLTNRRQLLAEMRRVLRPAGWLVISTTHPTADWRHFGGSYYDDSWVDLPHGPGALHFQRMTVETFLGELLDAGFLLEKLVEPRPRAELRTVDEAAYTRLTERPSFLAARLRSGD
ncbi:class I SAM-dependent methyltransferase [Micromonospora sp. NPDC048843]|uniref:class I SAM-dependent methyltransferase n=1 Tax=Micromonospora sp. NPDC048843 TaxID=3155389 RepID=UPI0033DD6C14